jgi:serine/threonine protein phosphatase 1
MRESNTIASIREVSRIWAIGAVHGDASRLQAIHNELHPQLRPDDALVYLGNYLGYGAQIVETVDELLDFRRRFLAQTPLRFPDDIVYLRGSQEEMWQKLLQLQFASDPVSILNWVISRGVDATLKAYGGSVDEGNYAATGGTMQINNWTRSLRDGQRAHPGHDTLMAHLKRAAASKNGALLFVNCGIDPQRPLAAQSDSFWWAARSFDGIASRYDDFERVIRGYDPEHGGFSETDFTVTLDGGCGFGGKLIAACFDGRGAILESFEV